MSLTPPLFSSSRSSRSERLLPGVAQGPHRDDLADSLRRPRRRVDAAHDVRPSSSLALLEPCTEADRAALARRSDQVQATCHALAHSYQRCTRAVSVVAPVLYVSPLPLRRTLLRPLADVAPARTATRRPALELSAPSRRLAPSPSRPHDRLGIVIRRSLAETALTKPLSPTLSSPSPPPTAFSSICITPQLRGHHRRPRPLVARRCRRQQRSRLVERHGDRCNQVAGPRRGTAAPRLDRARARRLPRRLRHQASAGGVVDVRERRRWRWLGRRAAFEKVRLFGPRPRPARHVGH